MKREDGLGQDQVPLGIFEDDGEGFEGHREMMKDVDRSSLVMKETLGNIQRMRVPDLARGVKRRDLLSIKELRGLEFHRVVSGTLVHSKAAVALDDQRRDLQDVDLSLRE